MAIILSFLLSSGSKNKEPIFICLNEAKASLRFKTWIASAHKKVLRYTINFPQKPWQSYPLLGSPKGPYIVGGPTAGHFVYPSKTSSSRFPSKGALPEAPTMESPKGGKQSPFVQSSKPSSRFPNRSLYYKKYPSLEPFLLSKSHCDYSLANRRT